MIPNNKKELPQVDCELCKVLFYEKPHKKSQPGEVYWQFRKEETEVIFAHDTQKIRAFTERKCPVCVEHANELIQNCHRIIRWFDEEFDKAYLKD